MKKILIALCAAVLAVIIFFLTRSSDVAFEPLSLEELDADFQDSIEHIEAPGIYFITKDDTLVLYSNLGKSGLYTYPYAEISQERNKLVVNIKSQFAQTDEMVKENLIGRIDLKKLPPVKMKLLN